MARVGLISDTHGLVRPEALARLAGVDAIVHAGDVGGPVVLEALGRLAPVTVVRGNNDVGPWAATIPPTARLEIAGVTIYVVHALVDLDVDPAACGIRVVVSGHSHRPAVEERAGVLYVNPGSAGPRRFTLPIALAELDVAGAALRARIVEITPAVRSSTRRTRRVA